MKETTLAIFSINSVNSILTSNAILILIVIIILFILVTLIFMYKIDKFVNKTSQDSVKDSEKYLKIITSLRQILEDTRKDSFNVLQKVNNDSLNMFKENTDVSEVMEELIKRKSEIIKRNYLQELKKSSELLNSQFQIYYKKEFANNLLELKSSHNLVNKKILEESQNLISDIHTHMISNHDLIVVKIDEDMTKTEKFLEIYRQNKISEFEREFKTIASSYVKTYLKKSLNFEEHEEIIESLLKDFKRSVK